MNLINTISKTSSITLYDNWKLAICIFICQLVGLIPSFIINTQNNIWYDSIIKPSWNPPSYLFEPVWITLYFLMGISLWIVWKSNVSENKKFEAQLFFAFQLFLNFWWSIIFFKFQSPLSAFVEIIVMILLILFTMHKFSAISKTATWLLVPYISWVCFATILNYKLWFLNN